MPFAVLKFGGTSVSTRARWEVIAEQMKRCMAAGETPVVVCSAVSGITSALEEVLDRAAATGKADGVDSIMARHVQLATELEISLAPIDGELEQLRRLVTGAALLGEAGPRIRARVMSLGERMSTKLGAEFLRSYGIPVHWLDATEALTAMEEPGATPSRRWLQAVVGHAADPALQARLGSEQAVITQGFMAKGSEGVVLLGRGGSDTSATVFAARLAAVRCEIWTDVPGMFTANPRQVPGARLLRRLDYDEAQEIATMGAKVLHPRCLAPVRDASIPLQIRCTQDPALPNTEIGPGVGGVGPQVKAISHRTGIVLVSMETVGMWQQVGFLADVFAVFKRLGMSVDSVSTSETNVTATLDPGANALEPRALEELVNALAPYCAATVTAGCASVSLVGRGIRAILHRLAPALQLFEDHRVHLVTQAASDLNLTVVVDDDQATRLVDRLHATLFAHRGDGEELGPTWTELMEPGSEPLGDGSVHETLWYVRRVNDLRQLRDQTPLYVYDRPTLEDRARSLVGLQNVDRVLFAMKANPNEDVLDVFRGCGVGFETVSLGEVDRVLGRYPDLDPKDVLFTPNFAQRETYLGAFERGVRLTLDNLHPLQRYPEVFAGREVFLRIDPGKGRGHHEKVRTAGARSKFGISPDQFDEAAELVKEAGVSVVGLHAHAGSGVLDPTAWQDTAAFLARVADAFPDVRVLDLGGGLGVPDRPGARGLDLKALDAALGRVKQAHPKFDLWLEPGRFLVAEAGVLLLRVTQRKRKGDLHYVGVDAGMNALIRPMLYGAWHPIANLDRLEERTDLIADVVGPICETGDVLGHGRRLPATTDEGDLIAVGTAGAYGAAMASRYNLRALPSERVLE